MTLISNSASYTMVCPLCSSTTAKVIDSIFFDQIWFGLTKGASDIFHEEVIKRHTPCESTNLIECRKCGLQYFSPAVPGDSDFYEQLTFTESTYYNEDKWDFRAALDWVDSGCELLDIACGGGAWLQKVGKKGVSACGIDTNPSAVASARGVGLQVYCEPLEIFVSDNRERFDIITAFQVLEHISDVSNFVKAAISSLKPGGRLIVTVPNRLRCVRDLFEPLDHPPHHISRWSAQQFAYLEGFTGLKLKAVRYEEASISECRSVLRKRIAPVNYTESIWARAIGRIVFAPTLYGIYRQFGLLDRWRLWRMSMIAVFQKNC